MRQHAANILPFGTKEDVRNATIKCIKKASPGGGHILALSSNMIHCIITKENFLAMIEIANEYGKYPIRI